MTDISAEGLTAAHLSGEVEKPTPGPWRANSSWIEGPKMALRVACVDWPKLGCAPRNEREARANARLIAAAPDLLAALYEAREFIDGQIDVVDGSYGEPAPNRAMTLAREIDAAIAKAEGR